MQENKYGEMVVITPATPAPDFNKSDDLPHIARDGKRVRPPKPRKTRSATAEGNVRKFSDGIEMLATGNGWRKIATVKPNYKR